MFSMSYELILNNNTLRYHRDHVKGISQKIGAGSPTVLTKAEEQEIVATCQVSTIIITNIIFLLQVFLTVTL